MPTQITPKVDVNYEVKIIDSSSKYCSKVVTVRWGGLMFHSLKKEGNTLYLGQVEIIREVASS